MTNREYLNQVMDELFDASHKTSEQLALSKKYCDFEDDIIAIIRNDFSILGCNTSTGEPTFIGRELWFESKVKDSTIELVNRKYRQLQ